MEKQKVDQFLISMSEKFPKEKIELIKSFLEKVEDESFIYRIEYKDPQNILLISIFLGGLGVDRFMLGQIGAGLGKLFTLGGFGIWTIFDWINIKRITKELNYQKLININNHKIVNENVKSAWYDNKTYVILLCIFFFPVGLYGIWNNKSISNTWKIAVSLFWGVLLVGQISENTKKVNNEQVEVNKTESYVETIPDIQQGQILHSEYFDIVVNKAEISKSVNTGNEYTDLPSEHGITYLIINATFKNIDTESRGAMEGSVWINYNGKDYEFDKAETILLKGWGLGFGFEQINPLTSITTNIVYKIPSEIKGKAFWQPGRTDNGQKIFLGDLN